MAIYFSKNKEDLVFIDDGMGVMKINGKGSIYFEDTATWYPDETWKEAVTTVTVCDWITEIFGGVLEQFPNVKKLNLPKPLRCIEMTDALKTLLHANNVLVQAAYGSYGDAFAQEHGLRFLPENIELGWHRDEAHDESTKLVLRFYEDGTMDLLIDIFTTGISAGSSGGASLDRPMPEEYHPGCTLEEFADMFPARYYKQIMNNHEVQVFLQREAEHENESE
ncbi:MAG: hypothetical protein IJA67_14025 [Oscillospiraceae bacterium]|nr:hypothetical protein [Oscillospiraceae bacterium]